MKVGLDYTREDIMINRICLDCEHCGRCAYQSQVKTEFKEPLDYLDYREGMDNTIEIFDIKVRSERRKGKGKELFNKLLVRQPRLIYGFTRESNELGRAFYKALGFRETVIPNFYQDENAIMIIYENSVYRKI